MHSECALASRVWAVRWNGPTRCSGASATFLPHVSVSLPRSADGVQSLSTGQEHYRSREQYARTPVMLYH